MLRSNTDGSRFGEEQLWWQQVLLGPALMAAGLARITPGGNRFGLGKLWWQQVSPRPSLVAAG